MLYSVVKLKHPQRLTKSLRWWQCMEITQKLFPVAFEKMALEKFSTERRKKPMIELVLLYFALRLFYSASMCSKKELENKKTTTTIKPKSHRSHTGESEKRNMHGIE